MNNKILLFWLNIFSILIAFLLGYLYEKNMHVQELNKEVSKKYLLEIKQTKTKLEINNPYPNVEIKINWESLSESGIIIWK
jgi:hypothetical protein